MKTALVLAAAGLAFWPAMEAGNLAPVATGATTSVAQTDDFSWKKRMSAGQTLEIKGVNGDVRAVLASGSEAEVTATKNSRRSDPDEVEIKVIEHADGVTICAVYPTPRRSRQENECAPGDEGHMNTENNGWSFATIQTNANNAWNTILNRIQVTGGTTDNLKQFYTALYRVFINPNISSDVNGQYRGVDNAIKTVAAGRTMYRNISGWDIYRSWASLAGLIAPEASDIAESMVLDAQIFGSLPRWTDQHKEDFIMPGDPGPVIVTSIFVLTAPRCSSPWASCASYHHA